MKSNNPYVNTLVEMGYDRQDCEMVASAGLDKTSPCVIHGRTFDSQEQYDEELAEYLNGLWKPILKAAQPRLQSTLKPAIINTWTKSIQTCFLTTLLSSMLFKVYNRLY